MLWEHEAGIAKLPARTISVLTGMSKQERLRDLSLRVRACRQCPRLVASRTQTVFGSGDPDAEFMFVGEAPGREEDRYGQPFVGRAGHLLSVLVRMMGFRWSDVYIANVLKCRPDAENGNRKPEAEEMARCLPFLMEQVRIVRPRVIIALGATAMEGLTARECSISAVRGTVYECEGIPLMPTFHPAFVLRSPTVENRKAIWSDICRAMELAGYDPSDRAERVPEVD